MKRLLTILILLALYGCSTTDTRPGEQDWQQNGPDIPAAAFVSTSVGDSVITITDAPYYDRPNGTELGTVSEGSIGVVTRRKSGFARVDFEGGPFSAVVEEQFLDFYTDPGDPGDPEDPVAAFTFSTDNLLVNFFDQSTDDGFIASWAWDFGDGGSSTSSNPSHNYSTAGTYSVSLTVTDNDGNTDSVSNSISVSDSPGSGDYMLCVVGFSNTRQIINGAPSGYNIGKDIAAMGGNAIPAYGDDGARNYSQGVAVVQEQVNSNNCDGLAIMVGHRYADPDRYPGREGFRHRDVIELLFPPESGSPRYSELEYMENAGQLMDDLAPGLDHFFIPLHRYSTPSCERLGNNTVFAIELMIAEAVAAGYASPLTLDGEQYRLPTATPGVHISGDQCHLSEAGVDLMWNDPQRGLKRLLDSL